MVEMLVCLENADLFGLGFSMVCRPSNRQFTTSIWITTTLRWQDQLLGSTPPYSDEVKKEDRKIVEMLVCLELQSYLVWVFLCCYRSSNRQLHYKYWTITILQRKDQLVKEGNRRIVGMLVCFEIAELFGFWVSLCIGRLSGRRIFYRDWNCPHYNKGQLKLFDFTFPGKIKQEDYNLLWCIYCLEMRIYVNLCYFWSSVFLSSFRQQVPTNYKYLN